MKKLKPILIPVFMLFATIASAQADTSKSNVSFSGYTEVYYCFDLNTPSDHNRPPFVYSHNRSNEFNLNLGFVKAAFNSDRMRANLAIGTGTYMNSNYSAEPGVLKNIYEANSGIKLCKNKNVWVDAGVFASHIGFESAVSKDCWALTRSLQAENSPYFESGVKVSFTSANNKWFLSGLLLNGWQHIQRPEGNNTPAFGTQITYSPKSNITLNYSTFLGNDKPDSSKQMRYFNNLYGIFHVTDKIHITGGFDYGMEQISPDSSAYNTWFSPVLLVKVDLNNTWSVTARGEYYADENGVIIATGTENGFQTAGISLNIDYKIRENALCRIEGRTFNSSDNIFIKDSDVTNVNTFITSSLAISF